MTDTFGRSEVETAVAYDLLGLGEQIKIIIDANGVVTSVIPSFDN